MSKVEGTFKGDMAKVMASDNQDALKALENLGTAIGNIGKLRSIMARLGETQKYETGQNKGTAANMLQELNTLAINTNTGYIPANEVQERVNGWVARVESYLAKWDAGDSVG